MVVTSVNASPTADGDRNGYRRPLLALHSGRLLLQDLHVAGLAPVRAAHPRHGRARPARSGQRAGRRLARRSMRAATCWSSAPGRRALRPRAPHRRRASDVILVDDQPEPGGSLAASRRRRSTACQAGMGCRAASRNCAAPGSASWPMPRPSASTTTIWSASGSAAERRPTRCGGSGRRTIVLATGAIERPLLFANNDRPGVMSADAALAYLRRHGVLVGERIVVATNNDSAYASRRGAGRCRRPCDDRRHARRASAAAAPDGIEVQAAAPPSMASTASAASRR